MRRTVAIVSRARTEQEESVFRTRKRRPSFFPLSHDPVGFYGITLPEEHGDGVRRIAGEIKKMSKFDRQVIRLTRLGFGRAEAAAKLGTQKSVYESRLSRALDRLYMSLFKRQRPRKKGLSCAR